MSQPFPPPDPNSGVGQPVYSEVGTTPPAKRRSKAPLAIGALVVVALVAGGAFAVASMSDDDGASSPQEAVDQFFEAVGNEDVIGVLDTLPPGEREAFTGGITDVVDQLERVGVLADDTDLKGLQGIDLEFHDLTYDVVDVGDGVATVEVTGGTVSGAYDLSELPIGDTLLDTLLQGERPEGSDQSDDAIDPGLKITTVEVDGGWHVSLWYSIAEAARTDAGLDAPAFGEGIEAKGADSPEDAVEALMTSAVQLDLEGIIAILPPDEMAVLHDYAPLFLPEAQDALADVDAEGSLEDFSASADVDGDEATVTVDSFTAGITVQGETASLAFDGECVVVTVPDQDEQKVCRDDASSSEALDALGLEGLVNPDTKLTVRAVQVDGKWYVSPTRTMFGSVTDLLAAVDADGFHSFMERIAENPQALFQELVGGAMAQAGRESSGGGIFGSAPPASTVPSTSTSTTVRPTTTTTVAPTTTTTVAPTTTAAPTTEAPTTVPDTTVPEETTSSSTG